MLKESFDKFVQTAVESLREELVGQGHKATGRLAKSIQVLNVRSDEFVIHSQILLNDYWTYVNYGVKSSRIPFGSRKAAKSKYITALINWAKVIKPNLTDKQAKSFAFAVAHKHKKEGMPTRGSYSYSSNGRRLGFVDIAAKNIEDIFERSVDLNKYANTLIVSIAKVI